MEFVWIIIAVLLISAMNQLQSQIKRTNSILEKIAKQIGVPDKVTENIDDELKNLIAKGKKIEAVKRYREVTGFSLKESKEYVDSLN